MSNIVSAKYVSEDEQYPIALYTNSGWEKMSTEEALALAEELHMAVAQANINKWLEAA